MTGKTRAIAMLQEMLGSLAKGEVDGKTEEASNAQQKFLVARRRPLVAARNRRMQELAIDVIGPCMRVEAYHGRLACPAGGKRSAARLR
jgi:hypothetical protein